MWVGAAAAAFPDSDFVATFLGPLTYLQQHRGITHSLLLLPMWAALVALIVAAIWRFKPPWRTYVGVAALGIASHILFDLITSYGTMVFAPVSYARFAWSTTFVIDLWFTGIILAGLAASAIRPRTRVPPVAALAVLAAYVGFQGLMQRQAIDFGERHAREIGWAQAHVTATPRPVSPFNWTVFVERDGRYRYAQVNLIRKTAPPPVDASTGFIAKLDAPYRPLREAIWNEASLYGQREGETALVREAYTQPAFAFFRWFAAYPALSRVEADDQRRCVWFVDLRFVTPGRTPTPFQYGMCSDGQEPWRPYRLEGATRVAVS